MYYIFLKSPFISSSEQAVVIRVLHDDKLSEVEKTIENVQLEAIKKLLRERPTKDFALDPKYENLYPLEETPKKESFGELGQGVPSRVVYTYSKDKVSRGWIYNSNVPVTVVFDYSICRYDNVSRISDPILSKKVPEKDNKSIQALLIETLKRNERFSGRNL